MGSYHTVVQGECLAIISRTYGFLTYQSIYDAPENAEFRQKRPNPNIIYPGDQLYIPDKQSKTEQRVTGASHTFQIPYQKTLLRVIVRRDGLTSYACKKYELTVNGDTVQGQTDSNGLLEQQIPPDATAGSLKIWLGENDSDGAIVWDLSIGFLDPVDTVTGVQARLNNLGYYCGAVDGILGPKTETALRAFQIVKGLSATGELDAATRSLLEGGHDGSS